MNKIFFSIILTISIAIASIYLKQYDGTIIVDIANYKIYTSIFFFILMLILLLTLIALLVKLILHILKIPNLIINKLYSTKFKSEEHKLLYSFAMLLINNQHIAHKLAMQVKYSGQSDIAPFIHLLLCHLEQNIDKKNYYLQLLIDNSNYKFFAAKNIAKNLIYCQNYQQASDYLTIAYNIKENDAEVLEMLIDNYAQLGLWNKIKSTVNQLEEIDATRLAGITNKISDYYIIAADSELKVGKDQDAMNYLKEAIWYNPISIEAIRLICKVNIKLHLQHHSVNFITNALKIKPTSELVSLYIRFAEQEHESIFNNLQEILMAHNRKDLLIIAATILDLESRVKQLGTGYYNELQVNK